MINNKNDYLLLSDGMITSDKNLYGYKATDICSFIIEWCNNHAIEINNLKVQMLLYFLQGEYSLTEQRLIKENFYTKKEGPIIPEVFDIDEKKFKEKIKIREEDILILNDILESYASYTTWDLSNLAKEESPYMNTYNVYGMDTLISYKQIENYYKTKEDKIKKIKW